MAAPTAAFAGTSSYSPESRQSVRASELWTVTGGSGGSADGDTCTITPNFIKKPQVVIGAVSYTISGQAITATLITALAQGEVIAVEVVGYN